MHGSYFGKTLCVCMCIYVSLSLGLIYLYLKQIIISLYISTNYKLPWIDKRDSP